jgi:hypothetical protein
MMAATLEPILTVRKEESEPVEMKAEMTKEGPRRLL